MRAFYYWFADHFAFFAWLVYGAFALFFTRARGIHARLAPVAVARRPLTSFADALLAERIVRNKKTGKAKRLPGKRRVALPVGLVAWLQSTRFPHALCRLDWLLYDKLMLLPDANTGAQLNFFFMFYVGWISYRLQNLYFRLGLSTMIRAGAEQTTQAQLNVLRSLLLALLFVCIAVVPLLFLRKNREFYYDFAAVWAVLYFSTMKAFTCFPHGCCIGVFVYFEILEVFVLLLIVAMCILFMHTKLYRPGRACSFCLFSFAIYRFSSEFFRYYNPGFRYAERYFIAGLSVGQVIAIGMAIAAIVWLFVLPVQKRLLDNFWMIATKKKQQELLP